MGPTAKECRQPLETGKGKKSHSPVGPPGRMQPALLTYFSLLISRTIDNRLVLS